MGSHIIRDFVTQFGFYSIGHNIETIRLHDTITAYGARNPLTTKYSNNINLWNFCRYVCIKIRCFSIIAAINIKIHRVILVLYNDTIYYAKITHTKLFRSITVSIAWLLCILMV